MPSRTLSQNEKFILSFREEYARNAQLSNGFNGQCRPQLSVDTQRSPEVIRRRDVHEQQESIDGLKAEVEDLLKILLPRRTKKQQRTNSGSSHDSAHSTHSEEATPSS